MRRSAAAPRRREVRGPNGSVEPPQHAIRVKARQQHERGATPMPSPAAWCARRGARPPSPEADGVQERDERDELLRFPHDTEARQVLEQEHERSDPSEPRSPIAKQEPRRRGDAERPHERSLRLGAGDAHRDDHEDDEKQQHPDPERVLREVSSTAAKIRREPSRLPMTPMPASIADRNAERSARIHMRERCRRPSRRDDPVRRERHSPHSAGGDQGRDPTARRSTREHEGDDQHRA